MVLKHALGKWGYPWIRWVLGGIFIFAGMSKLIAPDTFAVLIKAYGILPDSAVLPVAVILPAIEVLAGAGLLVDLAGCLSAVTALLVLFIGILGYGIWMGLDVDCGCFGPGDPEADAFHGLRSAFIRDLVMLGAVVFLFAWRRVGAIEPVRLSHWKRNIMIKGDRA